MPPKLPQVSGRDIIQLLQRLEYEKSETKLRR